MELPAAASSQPSPEPSAPTPGSGTVFGNVLWRSMVLASVGGAVIGVIVALYYVIVDDETGIGAVGLVAFFGGAVGVVLGLIVGVILAFAAVVLLSPGRDRQRTVLVIRALAAVLVFAMLRLLLAGDGLAWVLVGLGALGAWITSPLVVAWYPSRVDEHATTSMQT